jgi:hypothetical protein
MAHSPRRSKISRNRRGKKGKKKNKLLSSEHEMAPGKEIKQIKKWQIRRQKICKQMRHFVVVALVIHPWGVLWQYEDIMR